MKKNESHLSSLYSRNKTKANSLYGNGIRVYSEKKSKVGE